MVLGVEFDDAALTARVEASVQRTEAALEAAVRSSDGFLDEAAGHLFHAGGKRFRPMLVALAAELGDPERQEVTTSAVVVELTHLATLYHDDVMDEAPLRRGAPSANARWTNSLAILVGDFLFAQASDRVATLGPEAVSIQARTFSRLVRGQIRETIGPRDGEDPLEHYLDVVADKTGSLIATSARFGAMMAGASSEHEQIVTDFGERIGVAFQLSDDIIDIASESGESGKTPGTDLREGVPTLPTLFAQRSSDPADAELLARLSGPISDDAVVEQTLTTLRSHAAMSQARAYVRAETDAARERLSGLPVGSVRSALEAICDTLTTRIT
ncbi:polyprenyl synthetase family protein [Aeromicrobium sp. CTD01-1L150]|uniref:polyprenyl synthetase family protein n=1 Tax=Aeromicrobium sp. CTD01-1L150 TaxID=3341830 RepID=UPI0035BF10C8